MADDCGINRMDITRMRDFKRANRPQVANKVEKATVIIACSKVEPRTILGWICAEPPSILHYVYVSSAWRKAGLARALVEACNFAPEVCATHYTMWGFPRLTRLFGKLNFNPILLVAEG